MAQEEGREVLRLPQRKPVRDHAARTKRHADATTLCSRPDPTANPGQRPKPQSGAALRVKVVVTQHSPTQGLRPPRKGVILWGR